MLIDDEKLKHLRSDENLNRARLEEPLHNALVLLVERFVVMADTVLQRLGKPLVVDMVKMGLEVRQLNVQEQVRLVVRRAMHENIVDC